MRCTYSSICPFPSKRTRIGEGVFKANIRNYCENYFVLCAVYEVIERAGLKYAEGEIYPGNTLEIREVPKT